MNKTRPTITQSRKFCIQISVSKKWPYMIVIVVRSPSANALWESSEGLIRRTKSTYSPNKMQLLAVKPSMTACTVRVEAKDRGWWYEFEVDFVTARVWVMDLYSSSTVRAQPEINAPPTRRSKACRTLPVALTMEPGVAKMPLPMIREITRM